MLIKITCSKEEVSNVIEYYTEQGFNLEKKLALGSEIDLWFKTEDKYSGYSAISHEGAEGYLEFQDGSVSRLYVRRDRTFDD